MRILFVTSEIAPWIKTGGLGDVAAALPRALHTAGVDVRILAPAYPALFAAFPQAIEVARPHLLGGQLPTCSLRSATTAEGVPLLLLDYAPFFDRAGNPYITGNGQDWADNYLRFGLLSRVAAWLGTPVSTLDWRPQVIHCNDWQTALTPVYLHLHGGAAKSLLSIHNLAFQGLFPAQSLAALGLPEQLWRLDGVEFHGQLSFLKGGMQFADALTTVSPTYAQEIATVAEGMGLDGLIRHRAVSLTGILNGIDDVLWNPATDPTLIKPYDAQRLGHKAHNQRALRRQLGLCAEAAAPLLGVVSRFTHQKGLDLLAEIAEEVVRLPAQLAILGSGEAALEARFAAIAARHPDRCALTLGFDEQLAHRIEVGADIFVMPSRFEPCGLNQMYSQRYGTPPVVRATGGLADSVTDADIEEEGTGFVFSEATPAALLDAIQRAVNAWHQPRRWRSIQRNGMKRDFSWIEPARRYAALYAQML